MRSLIFAVAVGLVAPLSAAAQTCTNPASAVFVVIEASLERTPLRSDDDFEPIKKMLNEFCFKRDSAGWSYSDSNAKVTVMPYPGLRSITIVLLPHTEKAAADGVVAALIDRAKVVRASDGDAIDVELAPRRISGGTVTDRLGFRLNGGAWFRTAMTIDWAQ